MIARNPFLERLSPKSTTALITRVGGIHFEPVGDRPAYLHHVARETTVETVPTHLSAVPIGRRSHCAAITCVAVSTVLRVKIK